MKFQISSFFKPRITPQIVELKGNVLQTVKILKLVKTGYFGCQAKFAEVLNGNRQILKWILLVKWVWPKYVGVYILFLPQPNFSR